MAILNGLIRKMNGSAGDFTFKTVSGRTVVSEKITSTTNRRTSAQQKQRMKWANVIQVYKGFSPLLDSGFENKALGVSDYNMFVKVNNAISPVYLTKEEVAAGACVIAPYQITQGTLPSIVITGTGVNRVTDIVLGSLTISASTTVKAFSNAVVQNNPDYEYGDQISYFLVKQLVNATTQIPYCQFYAWSVVLDKDSNVKLLDQVSANGFTVSGGKLAHSASTGEGDCAFCWVHSRKEEGNTKVSTQFMLGNNSKLSTYTSDAAYQRAVQTYGGENNVFLTPNDGTYVQNPVAGPNSAVQSTKKTLTLTVSPAGAGTVSGAGDYDANATVQITATAGDGYTFKKWNDNDTNSTRTVTMSSDLTLQAVFETTSSSGGSSDSSGSGWGSNNNP